MVENSAGINDLHAYAISQGFPKESDVHSIPDFSVLVGEAILAELKVKP